jgi:LysR family glycine cleavage system transcriptional activator
MHRNLPPFPAVRAFEASARHCSFKLAAEELCLTQSAVSHQVKTLEDYLGVQLFLRETRGVVLTSEGEDYLHGLTDVLDHLAAATAQVRSADASGPLSVRATPGFASRWLVPRLAAFHEAWPAIELHISGSVQPVDFARENVDVEIRWGCKPSPGLRVDPLLETTRFPVASPALLKNGPALRHPDDLKHFTLLHDKTGHDWARWLDLAGASFEAAIKGPRFAHCDLLLSAAAEGQGVALAFDVLVVGDLASDRLVRPFNLNLPPAIIYSVVTPEAWSSRPKIAAFRNWLLMEAGMVKQGTGHSLAAA